MKYKLPRISFIGASIMALAACAAEQLDSAEEHEEILTPKQQVIITATHESQPQSKTVLNEDGTVYWLPDDAIGVFFGKYNVPFHSYSLESAVRALFVGEIAIVTGDNETGTAETSSQLYYSIFPYSMETRYAEDDFPYWRELSEMYIYSASREGDVITTLLPSIQRGVPGTFDRVLNITLGRSMDYQKFTFYNVLGGIRFKLSESGINKVVFKGNEEESIAGVFSMTAGEDKIPQITGFSQPKTEISLVVDSELKGTFQPGVWYYMMIPPTTFAKGYTMSFYKYDGYASKVSNDAVTVKRSVFGSIENPDKDLVFEAIVHAESLDIEGADDSEIEMYEGKSLKLTASVTPSDCTFPIVWSSSNTDVVTVDEEGNLTAVSHGYARITVSCDELQKEFYVYVYYEEGSGVVKPTFEIVSVDLSGAEALALISVDEYDNRSCIYTVDENGNISPLKFTFASDDSEVEQMLNEKAWVGGRFSWMTDEFIFINDIRVFCEGYTGYYGSEYKSFVIRLSDNKIINIDNPAWSGDHWHTQKVYGYLRWSYDKTRLYATTGYSKMPYCWYTLFDDQFVMYYAPLDFSGSSFDVETERVILDRNNNLAYMSYKGAYVFFNDGGMADIPLPEGYDHYYSRIVENNYNWYLFCSNYGELAVYQIQVTGPEINVTQVATSTDVGSFNFSILRNDDSIVLIDRPDIVTFNPKTKELKANSLTEAFPDIDYYYLDHDVFGIAYTLSDGVLTKYDLVNLTVETINTDRSNVPQMTSTTPYYDSANNCFHETGTRYSDTKTITVVTDCTTGQVTVYEGAYESIFKSYFRLRY